MASTYILGPFHLDAETDTLFRGGEPVSLGRRAVGLLRVLVEQRGIPVSKDALTTSLGPVSLSRRATSQCRLEPYVGCLGKSLTSARPATSRLLNGRADALFVVTEPLAASHRTQIGTLALDGRLPTMLGMREYVEARGLMSYGPSYAGPNGEPPIWLIRFCAGRSQVTFQSRSQSNSILWST
jgi:hypothetical protein